MNLRSSSSFFISSLITRTKVSTVHLLQILIRQQYLFFFVHDFTSSLQPLLLHMPDLLTLSRASYFVSLLHSAVYTILSNNVPLQNLSRTNCSGHNRSLIFQNHFRPGLLNGFRSVTTRHIPVYTIYAHKHLLMPLYPVSSPCIHRRDDRIQTESCRTFQRSPLRRSCHPHWLLRLQSSGCIS